MAENTAPMALDETSNSPRNANTDWRPPCRKLCVCGQFADVTCASLSEGVNYKIVAFMSNLGIRLEADVMSSVFADKSKNSRPFMVRGGTFTRIC